ncbi:hypothetical protein [Stieleria mannarensis]|uniref:hypothetical protein n=1 Tax=Stieleria mannarensis TaxID=2755585 RepID=UPI00160054F1|nr:hypothetical protein [Rhodopirellula sp. JC639]
MANPTTKRFYAIQWTYGRCCDPAGDRIGIYHRFASAIERDAWCDDGPSFTTEPGYRESISSDDAELRRVLREEQRQGTCYRLADCRV